MNRLSNLVDFYILPLIQSLLQHSTLFLPIPIEFLLILQLFPIKILWEILLISQGHVPFPLKTLHSGHALPLGG